MLLTLECRSILYVCVMVCFTVLERNNTRCANTLKSTSSVFYYVRRCKLYWLCGHVLAWSSINCVRNKKL